MVLPSFMEVNVFTVEHAILRISKLLRLKLITETQADAYINRLKTKNLVELEKTLAEIKLLK